jgi:hypothetical protein
MCCGDASTAEYSEHAITAPFHVVREYNRKRVPLYRKKNSNINQCIDRIIIILQICKR